MRLRDHRAWLWQSTTPQKDIYTKIQIFYHYLVLDIMEDFGAVVSCELPFCIRVSKSLDSSWSAFPSLQSGFANMAPSWLRLDHLKEQTSDSWRHDKMWLLPYSIPTSQDSQQHCSSQGAPRRHMLAVLSLRWTGLCLKESLHNLWLATLYTSISVVSYSSWVPYFLF